MKKEKAMLILGEGVSHLEFAMKMFEWQVRLQGLAGRMCSEGRTSSRSTPSGWRSMPVRSSSTS